MVLHMAPTAERAMRSDARRNRARLIEVAAAAFRDEGLEIGVDELARRTGVGVATLYRHFPAKADLILAVMDTVLDELDAAAGAALSTGSPERALERFLNATDRPVPEPRLPPGARPARSPGRRARRDQPPRAHDPRADRR